jgi:hypothetical protein
VQGTVREVAGHKRAVAVRTPTLAHAPCRLGFGQPIDALSVGVQVSQRVMSGGTTVRCAALVRAASGQVGWTLFALGVLHPREGAVPAAERVRAPSSQQPAAPARTPPRRWRTRSGGRYDLSTVSATTMSPITRTHQPRSPSVITFADSVKRCSTRFGIGPGCRRGRAPENARRRTCTRRSAACSCVSCQNVPVCGPDAGRLGHLEGG